jgi:hypothetical protein
MHYSLNDALGLCWRALHGNRHDTISRGADSEAVVGPKRKTRQSFRTEAELCSTFLAALDRDHPGKWIAYAETADWDILLVRGRDAFQIGIQAKLALNIGVINQCLEHGQTDCQVGPDCRALLVPAGSGQSFQAVCRYIGVTIISVLPDKGRIVPRLPGPGTRSPNSPWHEWCPTARHTLPTYVPDVIAGASAPVRLTNWKIKALKIAALIELRGSVSRADFKHIGLDPRRWTSRDGWLRVAPEGYVIGKRTPKFAEQHPVVYSQIKTDFPKWAPPLPPPPNGQE